MESDSLIGTIIDSNPSPCTSSVSFKSSLQFVKKPVLRINWSLFLTVQYAERRFIRLKVMQPSQMIIDLLGPVFVNMFIMDVLLYRSNNQSNVWFVDKHIAIK